MAMMVPSGMATSSATSGADERAGQQQHDAVVRVVEQRRPLRIGEEIPERHMRKNTNDSFDQQ